MQAKLVTGKDRAATAAKRWLETYDGRLDTRGGSKNNPHKFTRGEILESLRALGPAPTPSQVTAVIGNTSWTEIQCQACRCFVADTIHAQEVDGIDICLDCLRRMIHAVVLPIQGT